MSHNNRIFLGFFLLFFMLSVFSFVTVKSVGDNFDGLELQAQAIVEPCDPKAAPSSSAGCGIEKFLLTIGNAIRFLVTLTLTVAPVLIAAGGIVILTAAGSTERVGTGKKIIWSAVIGILIALGSYLIIWTILNALNVDFTLFPSGTLFNP